MSAVAKIVPHLWYSKEAEEAAQLYASIFPDSRVDRVTALPVDSPSGPAGSVKVVEFTLFGQPFMAISAGPLDPFNHSISFIVNCDDQAEIDRYWDALLEGGGKSEACGWLRDKYGVCWQICPAGFEEMMADPDRERARRVAEAMMKMIKLDIAALKTAYEGEMIMARTSTYLNFMGNTEAAFMYYKSVFKSAFVEPGIRRMRDVPAAPDMPPLPEKEKDMVLHVELPIVGGHVLMGTDALESMGHKVSFGTNVSLNLEPDTRAETERLFAALADGGKVGMPLADMFWGGYFGSLTDKFGVQWMFNGPAVEKSKT